jgi:hypothetical protein
MIVLILLEATKSRSRNRSTKAQIDLQTTSQPAHPHLKHLAWLASLARQSRSPWAAASRHGGVCVCACANPDAARNHLPSDCSSPDFLPLFPIMSPLSNEREKQRKSTLPIQPSATKNRHRTTPFHPYHLIPSHVHPIASHQKEHTHTHISIRSARSTRSRRNHLQIPRSRLHSVLASPFAVPTSSNDSIISFLG